MNMFVLVNNFLKRLSILDFISFFLIRLYLSYIFWSAGTYHLEDLSKFSKYLSEMKILYPDIISYLIIGVECGGAAFLFIGLFVRWITVPMIVLMIFAIGMIHLENGWSYENNGVEFAVTYILMLLILFFCGGGRFLSLDYWVASKK